MPVCCDNKICCVECAISWICDGSRYGQLSEEGNQVCRFYFIFVLFYLSPDFVAAAETS